MAWSVTRTSRSWRVAVLLSDGPVTDARSLVVPLTARSGAWLRAGSRFAMRFPAPSRREGGLPARAGSLARPAGRGCRLFLRPGPRFRSARRASGGGIEQGGDLIKAGFRRVRDGMLAGDTARQPLAASTMPASCRIMASVSRPSRLRGQPVKPGSSYSRVGLRKPAASPTWRAASATPASTGCCSEAPVRAAMSDGDPVRHDDAPSG